MNPNGEPQPGTTPEGATQPTEETGQVEAKQKLDLSELVDWSPFEGVKIKPEEFEANLEKSEEKVSRYITDKLTGIDGKPLPDAAAKLTIEGVEEERAARVQEMLLSLAGNAGETAEVPGIQDVALDTLVLGVAIKPDALANSEAKVMRYYFDSKVTSDAYYQQIKQEIHEDFLKLVAELRAKNSLIRTETFESTIKSVPGGFEDKQNPGTSEAQDKIREELANAANPGNSADSAPQVPPSNGQPTS